MRKVEVVAYNPQWGEMFVAEAEHIASVLGANVVAIHHIGSTAIPSIHAKPIIDLLVEVQDIGQVDEYNGAMERLGYQVMGEFGIVTRRYFRKENSEGVRTHHVHIFPAGSEQVQRHLMFRDYLINHPKDAQFYSKLKQDLAQQYPTDIEKYMDGKDGLIKILEQKAKDWFQEEQL
ncbi:GrpB family protein [Spirulina subsalsa FACHB-351]|uniref:GrpB family protein n=1 Tax=Spirulina subsalsa FACHB-351 TaxID=234711 RepID=A0ABT3L5K2_9CYAN|nr:GrpB family protein [Spirulina subsalsa]MCW6036785.1 GrpB family protein [Spirulina subsalsa FACHB-351]